MQFSFKAMVLRPLSPAMPRASQGIGALLHLSQKTTIVNMQSLRSRTLRCPAYAAKTFGQQIQLQSEQFQRQLTCQKKSPALDSSSPCQKQESHPND